MQFYDTVDDLIKVVPHKAFLAVPPDYSYVPMQMIRALISRQIRQLHVLCVPIGGLAVDMLIGAGCVEVIETAAVSLGEAGAAPRFVDAIQSGKLKIIEATCPAIHTALQATEKGVAFMPLGGIIGSDILVHRKDWRVVDDPLGKGQGPIVLIPAIKPDIAVLHSPLADRQGNVWIGRRRELMTLAHASSQTLVSVERITEQCLLDDETMAAGTLPSLYVSGIAVAEYGAKPLKLTGHYPADMTEITEYARQAKTDEGFQSWLEQAL